jgi:hypothetical protein
MTQPTNLELEQAIRDGARLVLKDLVRDYNQLVRSLNGLSKWVRDNSLADESDVTVGVIQDWALDCYEGWQELRRNLILLAGLLGAEDEISELLGRGGETDGSATGG